MKVSQIRKKFLQYFENQHHTLLPSSPTIPIEDPTLLFTNAGMNQFKQIFLGQSKPQVKRAVTSQKCIRVGGKHNDLDNVGHTTRHLTFFEMLGNFSFGDYFKEKAIEHAWHVSTEVFQIDIDKIWVTVFEKDDEAFELWKKWIHPDRIVRRGTKDNFWMMGETGPCGPCSEILYDRGPDYGSYDHPHEDKEEERYFEFWNLVFMQFNQTEEGKRINLAEPSIDTGLGLERLALIKQGKKSVFEIDIFRPFISAIEKLAKTSYQTNPPAFHVIADHIRSLCFAIADGAQPSNVDRGYVLRKILRRAVRYGRQIGLNDPFLANLFPVLLEEMGDVYPELKVAEDQILEILTIEEENFGRTLRRGGNILQSIIDEAKDSSRKQISGEAAFKLKDTYGFPLEEILLIAKDYGLNVNLDSYTLLEEKAKEKSRSARSVKSQTVSPTLFPDFVEKHGSTHFAGYEELESNGSITGILIDGEWREQLEEGMEAAVVLNTTTFYPEMGGQVSDRGQISHRSALFEVKECKQPYPGIILHIGTLRKGALIIGEPVHTKVYEPRRKLICQSHTATHLLHWALEQVLGPHIKQAGSLVEEARLRFDFSHHKAVTKGEIREIENLVNGKIRENMPLSIYNMSYDLAKRHKEIKQFFGEKYGGEVRVVDIDQFSKELCGGTHVKQLADIGLFRISKESSIGSGVRRIEAVTGEYAEKFMQSQEDLLDEIAEKLATPLPKLLGKVDALLEEQKTTKAHIKKLRQAHLKSLASELLEKKSKVGDTSIIAAEVEIFKDEFAPLSSDLLNRVSSGALLIVSSDGERCHLLIKLSEDLVATGIKAGELIKEVAAKVGGSGGGKPDSAQAGGTDISKIPEAIETFKQLIKTACSTNSNKLP